MADAIVTRLDQILTQVKSTNGRVTALEGQMHDVRDVLYGDDERATEGLVVRVQGADEMLRQWRSVVRVGNWVARTVGAATLVGLANLAMQVT